jgi:hypothetical protein
MQIFGRRPYRCRSCRRRFYRLERESAEVDQEQTEPVDQEAG